MLLAPIKRDKALRKKKVMVIYETAGGGHQANARAIETAIHERYPEIEVFLMCISRELRSQRVKALMESYNVMLKSDPRMVKLGFTLLNHINADNLVYRFIPKARLNLEACIRREKPDLVLSVFSIINHAAVKMIRHIGWQGRVPYLIFCTDLTDGFIKHWVDHEADGMIALSELAAQQMVTFGYPSERIKVLQGLPVNPAFTVSSTGSEAARNELRLDPGKFTLLLTMGGVASKNMLRLARDIVEAGLDIQLMVVCGRNRLLERRMRRLAARSPLPVRVFGFTEQMPLLMEASDIVVTKPGPGTIAEAIEKLRPMVVDAVREAMPQEKGNLDFVKRHGLGDLIERRSDVSRIIKRLMDDKGHYQEIVGNMAKVRNPDAVHDLAAYIVSRIPEHAHTAPLARA